MTCVNLFFGVDCSNENDSNFFKTGVATQIRAGEPFLLYLCFSLLVVNEYVKDISEGS